MYQRGNPLVLLAGVGALVVILMAGTAEPASAQVSAGVVVDRDGLRHLQLAIGQHYGVPQTRVARLHSRVVHYDELPVVYFLAREARVSPEAVVALRERGWSWMDVAGHLGLGPSVFVAHLPRRTGPPYGKAHGYWRQREARYLRHLSDREIVDFVNVRFIAAYHSRPVHEVIGYRDQGMAYSRIQAHYAGHRGASGVSSAPPPLRRRQAAPAVPSRDARPTRMKEPPGAGRGGPPAGAGRGGPPGRGNRAGGGPPGGR